MSAVSCIQCRGECRCRTADTQVEVDDLVRVYGIMTYRHIAIHEGVSSSRVEQIEKVALQKLRAMLDREMAKELFSEKARNARKVRKAG